MDTPSALPLSKRNPGAPEKRSCFYTDSTACLDYFTVSCAVVGFCTPLHVPAKVSV